MASPPTSSAAISLAVADLERELEIITAASQRLKSRLGLLTAEGSGAEAAKTSRPALQEAETVKSIELLEDAAGASLGVPVRKLGGGGGWCRGWRPVPKHAEVAHDEKPAAEQGAVEADDIQVAVPSPGSKYKALLRNAAPLLGWAKEAEFRLPAVLEPYVASERTSKLTRITTACSTKPTSPNKLHMAEQTKSFQQTMEKQKVKLFGFWEEAHAKASGEDKIGVQAILAKQVAREDTERMEAANRLRNKKRLSVVTEMLARSDPFDLRHPQSRFHIVWAAVGFLLLMWDSVAVPLMIAWPNLGANEFIVSSIVLGTMYWVIDIPTSCFTGFYERGQLVTETSRVVKHYVGRWLPIDASMLFLDIWFLASNFRSFASNKEDFALQPSAAARLLRLLRILRLVRLAKAGGMVRMLTDVLTATVGQEVVELIALMVNTVAQLLVTVHILACLWFFIGDVNTSGECCSPSGSVGPGAGCEMEKTWVCVYEFHDKDACWQYFASFHYVIAQFTPAPTKINATNLSEEVYTVMIILFLLMTVGTAISRISIVITQVLGLSAKADSKRRKMQQYLHSNKVDIELSGRIMRFVEHKLGKRKEALLDRSLISDKLVKELLVVSKGSILDSNMFFATIKEAFNPVFIEICGCLRLDVCEKGDQIFKLGMLATGMVTVAPGHYSIFSAGQDLQMNFDAHHHFSELSLFGTFVHTISVWCDAYADTFVLGAESFATCTKEDPACGSFVYQYARRLLTEIGSGEHRADDRLSEALRYSACTSTDCYSILNMDRRDFIANFEIDGHFEPPDATAVQQLVDNISKGRLASGELLNFLETRYAELAPEEGTHAHYSAPAERFRTISAMLSVLYLVADRYDNFTEQQDPAKKLSQESWDMLQEFLTWSGIKSNAQSIQVVLIFLAIKGLGKAEHLLLQLPLDYHDPEEAVLFIVNSLKNVVPSISHLQEDARSLLQDILISHKDFNLGQFLQAENSPTAVWRLQTRLEAEAGDGVESVKISLVAALALMCGLLGGLEPEAWRGSKFLDELNCRGILMGLRSLRRMEERSCQEVYWNYMTKNAEILGLRVTTLSDCAFARLLCLCRVKTPAALQSLHTIWKHLEYPDRLVLQECFLADGIKRHNLSLLYLPHCLANAQLNPAVGLFSMLLWLVDLIEIAQVRLSHSADAAVLESVIVLSDLASFAKKVKSKFTFQAAVDHIQLVQKSDQSRIFLKMTSANWNRIDDEDSHNTSTLSSLRAIRRTALETQRKCEQLHNESATSTALQTPAAAATGKQKLSKKAKPCKSQKIVAEANEERHVLM
eukprot:TRINITY_DN26764_c0_g1_i1.p1 TRINITY_DN26764_c0_g1~~TRINITY_DN26764_c0_g1_i1.p1  ORF type:complete len:1324 (-),score=242.16 TRINITY_DN26764_c0_g1_i1:56-3970(-)